MQDHFPLLGLASWRLDLEEDVRAEQPKVRLGNGVTEGCFIPRGFMVHDPWGTQVAQSPSSASFTISRAGHTSAPLVPPWGKKPLVHGLDLVSLLLPRCPNILLSGQVFPMPLGRTTTSPGGNADLPTRGLLGTAFKWKISFAEKKTVLCCAVLHSLCSKRC